MLSFPKTLIHSSTFCDFHRNVLIKFYILFRYVFINIIQFIDCLCLKALLHLTLQVAIFLLLETYEVILQYVFFHCSTLTLRFYCYCIFDHSVERLSILYSIPRGSHVPKQVGPKGPVMVTLALPKDP